MPSYCICEEMLEENIKMSLNDARIKAKRIKV